MFLTRISVAHPVFATMMMLAIMVVGLFGFSRMPVEEFPEVDLPVVVVATNYTGAAPETVETNVTRQIEEAVNTIGGVNTVRSESFEGRSLVIVEFDLDVDSRAASQEVRDRVSQLEAGFPDEVDTPQITRFNPDDQPILSIAVSSPTRTLAELTTIADQTITTRLNVVSGVGQTTIVGGSERQVLVMPDPERLEAFGVSTSQVIDAIRQQNQDRAAGNVTSGADQRILTVEGRLADIPDFERVIVARDGLYPVYLSDVARVIDGSAELTSAATRNGVPALGVDVVQVQGANTVGLAADLRAEIGRLAAELATQDVILDVSRDNSVAIAASVQNVQNMMIEGAVLTVLIVFLFLNSWRSTVITGLTLPISVIGTFAVIYFLGYSLNTMTLLALSLAIGILIDDAIVVRENITRHLQMGKGHVRAALDGTNEIGLAVLASTLTIVAVFLPVAFMGGIIGRFFLQFGVTVSVAVMISLFVAFTLDPMMSSVWYDPASQPNAKRGPIGRLVARFDRWFERLAHRYRGLIAWTLRHRLLTLIAAILVFVGSIMLVPRIGGEFLPQGNQGEFQIALEAPEGSSIDYTAAKVRQVESALAEFPDILSTYSAVNASGARGFNAANIQVTMLPLGERSMSAAQIAEPLRTRLARIAGLDISINQVAVAGPGGKPLQISVLGQNETELRAVSDEITGALRGIRGAIDVESSIEDERPTLAVRIRAEQANDLGVTIQSIAEMLRPLVAGDAISVWNAPDGESYDVVVRLPASERERAEQLRNLTIATSRANEDGTPNVVRLDQVVEIVDSVAPTTITRRDLSREVRIDANVAGRPIGEVTADLNTALAEIDTPAGVRVVFGGEAEDMAESFGYAVQALGLAVVFIYLLLASQFGSFLQPLAIMVTLPLSLIGVLLGLLLMGSTLNIFSIIGFIMLMGLVTKNAILLVDYSNQARARGLSLDESLIEAGAIRLRPIVMTTLAMVFGMLPIAIGHGEGGEQRAPMAHAVIGGLLSSTVLTLFFVPVVMTLLDSFNRRIARFLPKAPPDHHEEAAPRQPAE